MNLVVPTLLVESDGAEFVSTAPAKPVPITGARLRTAGAAVPVSALAPAFARR